MNWIYEKVSIFLEEHIKQFAVASVVVGIFFPLVLRYLEGGWAAEYTILATAGDWLGGTSAPLFSLAGFLMMYGAYKMQQEDLRLTREEMQETRKEFETQNATLKRQEFETTFFHLLELHHQIVNGILYKSSSNNLYQGRQFFTFKYNELKQRYGDYYLRLCGLSTKKEITEEEFDSDCVQSVLSDVFPDIEQQIGHYYNNIHQTLRLLDKSILNDDDKMDFAKLLAAQLSSDELHLSFYYCIYKKKDKDFRDLVHRYKILDVMDNESPLNKELLHLLDESS